MLIELIIITLALINLTGLILIALDKNKARKKKWRIPEKIFFLIATFGGSPGVYAGMLIYRHKTRHLSFKLGIPGIFAVQVVIIYFLVTLWL